MKTHSGLLKIITVTTLLFASMASGHDAQGFTSLTQVDGRWFFKDVDGEAFILRGINHTDEARPAFEAKYGKEEWKHQVLSEMERMGFNSHGYQSSTFERLAPFFHLGNYVKIMKWAGTPQYVDLFDEHVEAAIRNAVAKDAKKYKNDTNLRGYMFSDIPIWMNPRRGSSNWVNFFRGLDADAPGKAVYVNWLTARYKNDVDAFNAAYGTDVRAFSDLLPMSFTKNSMSANDPIYLDDKEFIKKIAHAYYGIITDEFRRHDANHLLIGDNYAEFMHGDQLIVMEVAAQYVDMISVQPSWKGPFPKAYFETIHKATGKPIFIADFKILHQGDNLLKHGVIYESQEAAGQVFFDYIKGVANTSYMIGYSHCELADVAKARGIKQGLYDTNAAPYDVKQQYIMKANRLLESLEPSQP